MSVYGPYLRTESSAWPLSNGVATIEEGGGSYPVYIVWGSDDGTEVHANWQVSVATTGYCRGDENGGAAFAADGTETATVSASSCYSHKDSQGRHVWAVKASAVTKHVKASETYSGRSYDHLELAVTVTELATGMGYSSTATRHLGYLPKYTLTAFHYVSADTAVVEYSTTWLRDDDVYVLSPTLSTLTLANGTETKLTAGQLSGTVTAFDSASGTGTVALDATKFKRVAIGLDCHLHMHFRQSFPDGYLVATAAETLACENAEGCNSVSLSVGDDGLAASVTAKANEDGYVDPETVTVTLADGTLPGDAVTLDYASGETVASFAYVPLDVEVTFEAYGTYGTGAGLADAVSAVTRKTATIESNGCRVLDCVESGAQATLEYKMQDGDYGDLSLSPDSDEVQLAGRSRPSRYPTGSSTLSIDFEGAFEGDDDGGWRDVAEGGLCVLRFPGGGRWPVVVESVDTSHLLGDYTELSVSCEEVDWR